MEILSGIDIYWVVLIVSVLVICLIVPFIKIGIFPQEFFIKFCSGVIALALLIGGIGWRYHSLEGTIGYIAVAIILSMSILTISTLITLWGMMKGAKKYL